MRSGSLLGRALQPLAARNRCSGVPRSHLALEITARARFFVFGNTRKRRPSVSARSRGSNKRRWIRQHFRVSCGIPFEIPFGIALLRTLHCFELCFARLHRHRQVPYANLIYIYTNVNPCMTGPSGSHRAFCTSAVARRAPVERFAVPEQIRAASSILRLQGTLERPFRTQATNAPRGSGRERHFSNMLWRQSRLERLPSSILHFRGGSKGTSRAFHSSGADSSGTCRTFTVLGHA